MRTEKLRCTDGSEITQYIPECKADRDQLAAEIEAHPDKWDLGMRPEEESLRIKLAKQRLAARLKQP